MIDWLVQSTADHTDLAQGIAPVGLLGPAEQARMASFKIEKRRRDWLLGRWTAKRLVQAAVECRTGQRLPLDKITIVREPDGSPRIIVDCKLPIADYGQARSNHNLQSAIGNLQLSISHSRNRAFCALNSAAGVGIGADIEHIEPRSPAFVADYFTPDERALVEHAPADARPTLVTAIWSAKEAALKVLRTGLAVDTRSVECALRWPPPTKGWGAFAIRCDQRLLGDTAAPALTGWWRVTGQYVLTIAAGR